MDNVEYCNSGDWVESLSALVEEQDGALRLLSHDTMQQEGYAAMAASPD
jgi:UDP-2,3-diacylglucosamine pyrophosphatase LpxH